MPPSDTGRSYQHSQAPGPGNVYPAVSRVEIIWPISLHDGGVGWQMCVPSFEIHLGYEGYSLAHSQFQIVKHVTLCSFKQLWN